MRRSFQRQLGGRTLALETGWLAGQASSAVTVRYGDTVVLVTACMGPPREGVDFFPLTVDYEERHYAAGKIPGSFFRREGRPSLDATLAGRLTDRPIRPLFPEGFRNEVQVIATVLSADQETPPDILAIIGASAALSLSPIPFEGPIGACRMGYVEEQLMVNPTFQQIDAGQLELVVAGTRDAVVMLEAGAKEVPEAVVLEAIQKAQQVNQETITLIQEMVQALGQPKATFSPPPPADPELEQRVGARINRRLWEIVFSGKEKGERDNELAQLRQEVVAGLGDEGLDPQQVERAFDGLVKREFRRGVLEQGQRPDGRGIRRVRPITAEVSVLPRVHGSSLFTRGQTQILSVCTLGPLGMQQKLDTLAPYESKRFLHHYNFPPYSVGEVRRIGSAGRRELGHGALAERALAPVLPDKEEFPYTIRLVSEALSSNGSTSMGSVCASSLALMDGGVPLKAPVAGVAVGLVTGEDGQYATLTDIQGLEDHIGDMDFKIAGTAQGITAIQLDVKVKGISLQVVQQALEQAREARGDILEKMREAIPAPRPTLSPYAPRILRIKIPVDKIGSLIGPGGKTIRAIIEETKASVDVEDDGTVYISSPDEKSLEQAKQRVEGLTRTIEVGAVITGKVTRIVSFGIFVEILPGKDGLIRLPDLSAEPVQQPEDVVSVGDEITAMVTEIDRLGRVNLSRRAIAEGLTSIGVGPEHPAAPGAAPHREPPPVGPRREPRPGFPPRREPPAGPLSYGQGPQPPRPPGSGDRRSPWRPGSGRPPSRGLP